MSGGDRTPPAPADTGAYKVLRLLDALKATPTGNLIYRQVESALLTAEAAHVQRIDACITLLRGLLEACMQQVPKGSAAYVEIKLIERQLEPPPTSGELIALQDAVRRLVKQIGPAADSEGSALQEAMAPLLEDYEAAPEPESPPVAKDTAVPTATVSGGEDAERESGAVQEDEYAPAVEQRVTSVYRHRLDEQRRDMQKLQDSLAAELQETVRLNEEFGVLLEVVLGELRNAATAGDVENLRQSVVREIEKLLGAHNVLATRLDDTHEFLNLIEKDSQKLTDELDRVRVLSLTDELTDMPNRRAFLRRLEDEVGRVQRYGTPLSLAMIDLDGFKEINDRFGHAVGDEILRCYAKEILSIFRRHDMVARYGGEEFAVLFSNTDKDGALRALNKVKKRAADTHTTYSGTTLKVPTFSAGLAMYHPGETAETLIERADGALYRAKRLGRDRIEFDEPDSGEGEPAGNRSQAGRPENNA